MSLANSLIDTPRTPCSGDEKSKTYEHSSKMATTVYGLHQHAKKKQNVVVSEGAEETAREAVQTQ
jgi:predicted ribosome-associated RNA-binding protein Tma20